MRDRERDEFLEDALVHIREALEVQTALAGREPARRASSSSCCSNPAVM